MKCLICKQGETRRGTANVSFQRGETVLLVQNVPAEICENCGEIYLDEETSRRLLKQAEEAWQQEVVFDIRRFKASAS